MGRRPERLMTLTPMTHAGGRGIRCRASGRSTSKPTANDGAAERVRLVVGDVHRRARQLLLQVLQLQPLARRPDEAAQDRRLDRFEVGQLGEPQLLARQRLEHLRQRRLRPRGQAEMPADEVGLEERRAAEPSAASPARRPRPRRRGGTGAGRAAISRSAWPAMRPARASRARGPDRHRSGEARRIRPAPPPRAAGAGL